MSFESKLTALTLVSAFALGALLLYLWDRLYTRITDKPPSERVRERLERQNRPLTSGRYWGTSIFYLAGIVLFAYTLGWTTEFRGWGRLVPLGYLCSFAFGMYDLQKRWRKQQADEVNQPSGGAT
jgi:hypothetical protein